MSEIIVINRGDSKILTFNILDYLEYKDSRENASIFFGITYPFEKFENAIIKKRYSFEELDSEGNITINLLPSDTVNLKSGVYYYTLKTQQLLTSEEASPDSGTIWVTTIIPKTKIIIND